MPFIGAGLHILLALFCAVHVVRSGQQLYWLFILFAFPLLGSIVYFVAIYLPNTRFERTAVRAVAAAAKAIDPTKALRQARADYELTPTAHNQMRLAAALLDAGQPTEAAELYERALQGPFSSDPDIRFGAARACAEAQRFDDAMKHVAALQATRADYRPDDLALLVARCYAGQGRHDDARRAFEQAIQRFGTFEAHADYAIWALGIRDFDTARRLQGEIDKMMSRWNRMARQLNEPALRRLKAAQASAKRQP